MWKSYGFPVFLLTESSTKTLQEVLHSIFMFFLKLATHASDGWLPFEVVVMWRQTLETRFFCLSSKGCMYGMQLLLFE